MLTVNTEGKPLAILFTDCEADGLHIRCQLATDASQWFTIVIPLDTLATACDAVRLAQIMRSPAEHEFYAQLPEIPPRTPWG